MNAQQAGFQLAFYYGEPLAIEVSRDQNNNPITIDNIKVKDAIKWISKFNSEKSIDNFVEKVKRNFKPTQAAPFPTLAHFEEIECMVLPEYYDEVRIGPDSQLTFKNAIQEFNEVHQVPINNNWDMENKDHLIQAFNDDKILKPNEMIKKYGSIFLQKIWIDNPDLKLKELQEI